MGLLIQSLASSFFGLNGLGFMPINAFSMMRIMWITRMSDKFKYHRQTFKTTMSDIKEKLTKRFTVRVTEEQYEWLTRIGSSQVRRIFQIYLDGQTIETEQKLEG